MNTREEAVIGKRSSFERIERDCYDTPVEAVEPLLPFLHGQVPFVEPCAGAGALMHHLERVGHIPLFVSDVEPRASWVTRKNVLDLDHRDLFTATHFVTNPPWRRDILHKLIAHLRSLGLPAWLLIDANWMFTAQAAPYLKYCATIVTIGRVKWIPDSTMTGKDDACWFLFKPEPVIRTTFIGKQVRL
jgi:hypothetical protein